MQRRSFLGVLGTWSLGAVLGPGRAVAASAPVSAADVERYQSHWKEWLPVGVHPDLSLAPVVLSDAQWRERLPGAAYAVLREEGTEPPHSSPYDQEKREGVFLCAGCDLPLFTSAMKYDSGTGWPSFFAEIPGHLDTRRDFRLIWPRTEYHCIRCGGHQGHVFDDGPPPTGKRWCNNGLALKFLPKGG